MSAGDLIWFTAHILSGPRLRQAHKDIAAGRYMIIHHPSALVLVNKLRDVAPYAS